MIRFRQSTFAHFGALFEQASDSTWLKPIEGMRGFAAFLVFFVHFDALFGIYAGDNSACSAISRFAGAFGNTGVDLFFVISGFLIYGIIIRRAPSYGDFMSRRVVRLYPVFLFVLMVYLLESWLFHVNSKIPTDAWNAIVYIGLNLLMLPGMIRITPIITVAWSLSYELFFYAILPLAVYGLGIRRWRPTTRALFFTAATFIYYIACIAGWADHPRLIMFAAGIILYEIIHESRIPEQLTCRSDYLAILGVCGVLALTGARVAGKQHAHMLLEFPIGISALLFFSYFGLALCAITHKGILARFFSLQWVRRFGNISYSYYLTHGATMHGILLILSVLQIHQKVGPIAFLLLEVGCFGITSVVAAGVYLLIERPFSLTKRRVPHTRVSPAPSWSPDRILVQ